MDKKLNFTELCDFFAKVAGVSATDAETFVHAFFDIIVEGLDKDGIVKINGLGTFKVVEVESRASVNINTGERFEINGHNRLTFIPADSLKEIINAPFAMFEPVEVDDDIDDDEEEEEEEKDILNEETATEEIATIEELPYINDSATEKENVDETDVAEEIAVDSVASIEIEEEMPQDVVDEKNNNIRNVEIEEEMPFEESENILPENIPEEIIEEQTETEEIHSEEVTINESAKIEEPVTDASENEKNEEASATEISDVAKEESKKKEISIPEKKEEIFFYTLPRKKKQNKLPKVAIILCMIIVCGVLAVAGLYFYDNNIFSTKSVKKQTAGVENVKTPEVNIVSTATDSVTAAKDSTINIIADTTNVAQKIDSDTQKDTIMQDTIVEKTLPKEEKPAINTAESFKIVENLASRELSTIFVADTTDYKITGTICTHKIKSEETLIKISLKYYGDKRLWPYIVKHNNMIRPNDLACDMLLKIPRLTPRK